MTTNNKYSKILLELKEKYKETLAELEADTNQVKARITSLDTLIEDPLLGSDFLAILQSETNSLPAKASTPKVAEASKPKAKTKAKKPAPKASSSTIKEKSSTPKSTTSQAKNKQETQKGTNRTATTLPMKKPYTQMLKMDAVAQFMRENSGQIMHIDDLVMELFGKLSQEDLKAERKRMGNTMYKGIKKELWNKVPRVPYSYIYEPSKMSEPKQSSSAKTQKSQNRAN